MEGNEVCGGTSLRLQNKTSIRKRTGDTIYMQAICMTRRWFRTSLMAFILILKTSTNAMPTTVSDSQVAVFEFSREIIPQENAVAYDSVDLKIHFPNRTITRQVEIPRGFSIRQFISYSYETKWGRICTSKNGLLSINEYGTDLSKNKYWTMMVNGNFLNVNSETVLNDGDDLVLEYHS